MNDRMKEHLVTQNKLIIEKLSGYFGLSVYQDDVAEDEATNKFHFFIFETGEMASTESDQYVTQDVYVHFVSEKRDDLDECTLDIISILKSIKFTFVRTIKERYQKGETDSFVDRISIQVRRRIKVDNPI